MEHFTNLFILLLTIAAVVPSALGQCKSPPPSSNFTLKGYYGLWYEIGKIQTPGGGYFEKDCVCTTIDVSPKPNGKVGDSVALNSCRKNTPQGDYLNATGQLIDMVEPGKWREKFFVFVPAVDYTVIYMDEDIAVEYDCSTLFGSTNYCIHVMARSQTADPAKIKAATDFALGLGLNSDSLEFKMTKQDNCWGY